MTTKKAMQALIDLGVKYRAVLEEARLGMQEAVSEVDEVLCNEKVREAVYKLSALCEACDELELWDEDEAAEVIENEYLKRSGAKEED